MFSVACRMLRSKDEVMQAAKVPTLQLSVLAAS